jgi:hypothetical protein
MKKVILSDAQLKRVVRLRQSGASWLRIEREMGIARRSAKKAYESWEAAQSLEQLKAARIQVATDEFREHMAQIIRLAEALVGHISCPVWFFETKNADEYLDQLWMRPLTEKGDFGVSSSDRSDRQQRLTVRQNRKLFEALKNHTEEKVQWQKLDQWKDAWNDSVRTLAKLRTEAKEILTNLFDKQRQDVRDDIKKLKNAEEIKEQVLNGVIIVVWRGALARNPENAHNLIETREEGKDTTVLVLGDSGPKEWIKLADAKLAANVLDICQWAAENLGKSELAEHLKRSIWEMHLEAEELEDMLDPLVLRPLLLRTRCELCPA